jgi:membrane protein
VLLGLSLSLTSYVVSMSDARIDRWGATVRELFALASPLIATAAYSAVYALVPNRKVAWRHALTGGLVTAVTGELMSRGFAAYVIHGSVLSIYGAFAAFPIFLIWIYLSWLTFLFGAAIAATLPQLGATRFFDTRRAGDRAITAIALLKLLLDARGAGSLRALGTADLSRALRTDGEELASLLGELETLGYVRKLAPNSESDSDEWILSCDPQTQALGPVFRRFAMDPQNSLLQRPDLNLRQWLAPAIDGDWLQCGLAQLQGASTSAANVDPKRGEL